MNEYVEKMDIEQSLTNIKNAIDVVPRNGVVLIYGQQQQALKLYNALEKTGCLDNRTHILVGDQQNCQQDVVFKYSTEHPINDVEVCTSAYVFLPRTKEKYDRVMDQFFHTIPLPNIPIVTGREVYALDYTNLTSKVFLL